MGGMGSGLASSLQVMQWWAHVHSLWALMNQLWYVFRSCQLPGLALKDLPNSRDHFHTHAFPAFLILPGKVRSEKAEECS